VVGAGPLIAAFNAADPEHAVFRQALRALGHAVISPIVLAEVNWTAQGHELRDPTDNRQGATVEHHR
jgi:hypothetical protein